MAYWLLKTEPGEYSFADLRREKKTVWNGVQNAVALKHIRSMHKGDLAFIYHTGDEKRIVGIAEITSSPYIDPTDVESKLAVVDIKSKQLLNQPVTLAEIKADKHFEGWDLIRIGRLSVVPTSASQWQRIMAKQS